MHNNGKIIKFIIVCFYLGTFIICGIFFFSQLREASLKPLWGDEIYGLECSMRTLSYRLLLIRGAPGQGSPAPLFYIIGKALDSVKESVRYFWLPPLAYMRLISNVATLFCLLILLFAVSQEISQNPDYWPIKLCQYFLLLYVAFAFLFAGDIHAYAAEMRPYALWNSLWFLAGGLSVLPKRKVGLFIVLLFLSACATAAIFQLFSLVLAFFIINALQRYKFTTIVKQSLVIFSLPLIIALYYCLKTEASYPFINISTRIWAPFWEFWSGKLEKFYFLFATVILCFIKKETRKYALLPLAMIILFFFSPLIYWVTISKSFFFTQRQYIYYDLVSAIVLLTFLLCLPAYVSNIKSRCIVITLLIITAIGCGTFTFRKKVAVRINHSIINTFSVFKDGLPGLQR